MSEYKKNSIKLIGAIGLGTGVMISAGIFALLGQVAELSGQIFPFIFLAGGIVTGFSAYSYHKLSQAYPSAGGIGMYLVKEYGKGTIASFAALLMAFSMVINQSLVARTFGTYTLQLFDDSVADYWVPILGVGLLIFAFLVNISGNAFIQSFTSIVSLLKIIGLLIFAGAALIVVDFSFEPATSEVAANEPTIVSMIAAISLTVLAFKGFTTITNQGEEIEKPKKNIGRAIFFSIIISLAVYMVVAWAVSSNLAIDQIIQHKDYALAEAAAPALGDAGVWLTVVIAIIATISGIIASIFAVSRMLAMLTNMNLIPHSHFGMPGGIQKHTLVYTVVIAMVLTVFFDLSRIASMGVILYLIMDMVIHYGLAYKLKGKVEANPLIVWGAFILDAIILASFVWVKLQTDYLIVIVSVLALVVTYFGQKWFLSKKTAEE
ncbi:amino acid/polyamine/organocation transporter (APC superfamily) [Streptohalobacillus salinus]|uniref:Amino acid/polyamine/organocation transporter (APC superfamily) n=1 Tax=Streptohalobacillus salinus TaxID=621096 RepID=A0A2V3WCZ4_9BACI|nr:APC family permease [Streptohalobacillus salinus]PXW90984.1 amino acid/polyamine/organocation transporter (APC superfamily) [Streptohalobacillus salinus]